MMVATEIGFFIFPDFSPTNFPDQRNEHSDKRVLTASNLPSKPSSPPIYSCLTQVTCRVQESLIFPWCNVEKELTLVETREISLRSSTGEKMYADGWKIEFNGLRKFHWVGFLGRGYFTFTLSLFTQEYIWAWKPVNCSGKPSEMLEG